MLRHRNDDAAARAEAVISLSKNRLVFFDMLDDVIGANQVEFFERRNGAGIHLKPLGALAGQSLPRDFEPPRMEFRPDNPGQRCALRHGCKYETRPAAN